MVENDSCSMSSWNDVPMVPASLLPDDGDNFSFPSKYDSGDSRGSRNQSATSIPVQKDCQPVRDEIAEYRRAYMESKKKGEREGNGKAVGTVHQNTVAS
jgi:hypothetical protein